MKRTCQQNTQKICQKESKVKKASKKLKILKSLHKSKSSAYQWQMPKMNVTQLLTMTAGKNFSKKKKLYNEEKKQKK